MDSDVYASLGIRPVINACGIYTDLGGSRLDPDVWTALGDVNRLWASIPEMLDQTGVRIAQLIGTEAARIVPGASAGIALATAACIARRDDAAIETLPLDGGPRHVVLQQVVHRYKYTRCALLGGGAVLDVGNEQGTPEAEMSEALSRDDVAAVLHPVHLDTVAGGLELERVSALAARANVPVIADAAYQVYPVELMGSFAQRGADITCISSKYYGGPNAGGFVAGREELVRRIATLDFTEFESGPLRTFGRAFKLDRTTIAATTISLERWLVLDHSERHASYARRAEALLADLQARGIAGARICGFTLDERMVDAPVNAVYLPTAAHEQVTAMLATTDPAVRCISVDHGLLFCTECVADAEVPGLADALTAALNECGFTS